jgi:ABC-type polar amino acid transport system ATPase subunit
VIKNLASKKIIKVIVTHEMNFATDIADRMIFTSEGTIIE